MSFTTLSPEILLNIILKLPYDDIVSLCQSNKNLYSIFKDPYLWRQKAYIDFRTLTSEFQNTKLNPIKRYQELHDINTRKFSRVFDMAYMRKSIEDYPDIILLLPFLKCHEIKEGDMVDFDGYRGTGLYYFDGGKFIKTEGEYGYFLPIEAWKMIESRGIKFFEDSDTGAEFALIPKNSEIIYHNQKVDNNINNWAISIRNQDPDEKIIINGKTYDRSLEEFY